MSAFFHGYLVLGWVALKGNQRNTTIPPVLAHAHLNVESMSDSTRPRRPIEALNMHAAQALH